MKKLFLLFLKFINFKKYVKLLGVNCEDIDDMRFIGRSIDFGSEPYLIFLGKHITISFDVSFITHDGGNYLFRNIDKYSGVWKYGKIIVHDNCFIGAKSIIMPGVEIGKNCVIGAGSVVTKSIPDNSVVAGNPARYICSLEEYRAKMISEQPDYDKINYKNNKKNELLKVYKDSRMKNTIK